MSRRAAEGETSTRLGRRGAEAEEEEDLPFMVYATAAAMVESAGRPLNAKDKNSNQFCGGKL